MEDLGGHEGVSRRYSKKRNPLSAATALPQHTGLTALVLERLGHSHLLRARQHGGDALVEAKGVLGFVLQNPISTIKD